MFHGTCSARVEHWVVFLQRFVRMASPLLHPQGRAFAMSLGRDPLVSQSRMKTVAEKRKTMMSI